jgi:hypothetical protein
VVMVLLPYGMNIRPSFSARIILSSVILCRKRVILLSASLCLGLIIMSVLLGILLSWLDSGVNQLSVEIDDFVESA